MFNISKILDNKFLVLSIVGNHARETLPDIFVRKQKEIDDSKKSFWLVNSSKTRTKDIQKIGKDAFGIQQEIYCLFIAPALENGARPAIIDERAKEYSEDNIRWLKISNKIKVTGKIGRNTTGLVLNTLDIVENTEIDLWQYSDFFDKSQPVKTGLGYSTVCVVKAYNQGMMARKRKIIGIGRLTVPYAIYLK